MLAATELAPLSREAFRDALLDSIKVLRAEDTRLYRLLKSGRCPRPLIQRYALVTVWSADLFCAVLAEMVEKAPDNEARLVLLENLLEEEGLSLVATKGLLHRPETSHPALARRFAKAVDAAGDPINADAATGAGCKLLANNQWVEAVAHLLIGQELTFADAAPAMAEALEAAGLKRHDVAFFWVHKIADRKHGEQALALVINHARGREQQDRCIAEARAGALAWMNAHGGLAS